MTAHIDVILPGLFQLPLSELDEDFLANGLPALNHILRYAQRHANSLEEFEALFADSLGLVDQGILPLASAFGETGLPLSKMLCQPTHLKADVRNAFVIPLDQSNRTKNDIILIIKDLSALFKEDCDMEALEDGLWLMRLKQCNVPNYYPHILSIIGRKVDPYIKQSRQALPWYQLINEMQMFMHSHEVNQRRLIDGLLPINSLWCWGAGELVVPPNTNIQCYCDDFVLATYANRVGLNVQPLRGSLKARYVKQNIYIDLSLLQALKSPNDDDLRILLTNIELNVFKPLVNAVAAGKLWLRLRTGHQYDYRLSRFSSLKRWRKRSNLIEYSV